MRELAYMSLRAARANIGPGLALQCVAIAIVAAYYGWNASAGFFNTIAELKERYSFGYSAATTCVFGGLVPYFYLLATNKIDRDRRWSVGAFFALFWMWKGLEVDLLYRGQALVFGSGTDFATVAKKVVFDQFIYCPLVSAPGTALAYRWMECRFDWRRFRLALNRRFFALEIPSVLVAIWLVWIPGTAAIYSLPSPLQLPLFTLVLCFYVLLVSALDKR